MSITLRFYNIIIPIENLKRVLNKEELDKLLSQASDNGRISRDKFLYKEGSMSSADNEDIIKEWEVKGLIPTETIDGQKYWKDLCLIEFPNTEPTLSCDWIEVFQEKDDPNIYARLKQ